MRSMISSYEMPVRSWWDQSVSTFSSHRDLIVWDRTMRSLWDLYEIIKIFLMQQKRNWRISLQELYQYDMDSKNSQGATSKGLARFSLGKRFLGCCRFSPNCLFCLNLGKKKTKLGQWRFLSPPYPQGTSTTPWHIPHWNNISHPCATPPSLCYSTPPTLCTLVVARGVAKLWGSVSPGILLQQDHRLKFSWNGKDYHYQ